MTDTEFSEALALAMRGFLVTDMGANDALNEALSAIAAAAPSPPPVLIQAARAAYAAL